MFWFRKMPRERPDHHRRLDSRRIDGSADRDRDLKASGVGLAFDGFTSLNGSETGNSKSWMLTLIEGRQAGIRSEGSLVLDDKAAPSSVPTAQKAMVTVASAMSAPNRQTPDISYHFWVSSGADYNFCVHERQTFYSNAEPSPRRRRSRRIDGSADRDRDSRHQALIWLLTASTSTQRAETGKFKFSTAC